MTWTRLMYIKSMKKAMQQVIPGKPLEQLPISKRYQAEVRKQFRIAGVPWIYDLKPPKPHHRDRKPKQTRASKQKKQRLQKIQKNLAESQKNILEYRQNRLNNRALGGINKVIAKTLPSFIKGGSDQIPEYLRKDFKKKGKDDEQGEEGSQDFQ